MSDDLHLAGVAERTRDGYLRAVRQLAEHAERSPDGIDEEQLRQWLLHLKVDKQLAYGSLRVAFSGIKFFFTRTCKQLSRATGRRSLADGAVSRLGLLAGLSTGTAQGPNAKHSLRSLRRRIGVAIDLGPARPSVVPIAGSGQSSQTATVIERPRAEFENSKTISGVVAQSVRAFQIQSLKNSQSGEQNRASKLLWLLFGVARQRASLHLAANIAQNLSGPARLIESNP